MANSRVTEKATEGMLGAWWEFDSLALSPILDAALAAFNENGYHGATVRDVAQRVGVTVPTLYYHHGSKEGLLLALLEFAMNELTIRTQAAISGAGDRPVDQFVDVVDCFVRVMCYHSRMAWLDAEARYLSLEARRIYASPRRDFELQLRGIVRDGIGAGTFRIEDVAEPVRALLDSYRAVATWYRPGGSLAPEEISARYVGLSLDALRTPRQTRDAGIRRARSR